MATRFRKTCNQPGCATLVFTGYCEKHKRLSVSNKEYDKQKRNKKSKQFYNSTAWKKCRRSILVRDRFICRICFDNGYLTPATVVHHKKEYKYYPEKGLDPSNLISVCDCCHNKLHGNE